MKRYLRMLPLALLVAATASAQILTTTLVGSNEPDGGDPDGFGAAVIAVSGTNITFMITANNLSTITGAHIHSLATGNIVVNPGLTFSNGVATGTFSGASQSLISDILANPSNYYFNVHSSEHPGGAIRGTLTGGTNAVTGAPGTLGSENPSTCTDSDTAMCLNGGRFRVETTWTKPDKTSGPGHGVKLTGESGYFWFFDSTNVEMTVKVLNACAVGSTQWVFASGLTNVQVVMKVTDTRTGQTRTYNNPNGTAFLPIQDTAAFPCP